MRYQKPIKGGRKSISSGVINQIRREIESIANKFNCSKSFVVATILSEVLKIDIGEYYYEYSESHRKVKKAS